MEVAMEEREKLYYSDSEKKRFLKKHVRREVFHLVMI